MTPRRRKPTSKALDETSEPSPKRLKASSATLGKRQPAPRAAKVNRQDPFWLTTNEKSPLANEDLYTELSDPKTYENFTKSDWDDLRECLPPNVPLSSDGYSIPIDFFKYDADFRRGIREFQEDLSTGRLDPGWQAAAAGAMEERARGDFDAHKENQFEEFWGQKQKLDRLAVAGESAKLKLDVMIQNGIFQAGDFLSYSRAMRTVNGKLLVEKECEIVAVGDDTLTFAIPPGQLKYSRLPYHLKLQADAKPTGERVLPIPNGTEEATPDIIMGEDKVLEEDVKDEHIPGVTNGNVGGKFTSDIKMEGQEPTDRKVEEQDLNEDKSEVDVASPVVNVEGDITQPGQKTEIKESAADDKDMEDDPQPDESKGSAAQDDVILHETGILSNIEIRILEIDGRPNLKEVRPSINAWKAFRGKRSNQDLGTLFEMREEFYVWKHSKIPKAPRSGAYGLRQ
ncbi:hypothetical protein ABVK25_006831 [Lepraria finkii]|uniref:DEUBAD domain-containing protein n=1 Tax=Lepraria finkii TaxID=1340010 RepID=A0ABR4B7Q4_9LECA